MDALWIARARLVTPRGIVPGAVQMVAGRLRAIRRHPPRGAAAIDVRGAYVAPGFIDVHVWGDPATVAREAVRAGTTAFLSALGPEPPQQLLRSVQARARQPVSDGAACLGLHLEGPFLNPARGGALPRRHMRPPAIREVERLARAAAGRLKLMTIAPELPGAAAAIRWCRRQGIAVSLGHSEADAATALRAVASGARSVTHVFNGMPPLHPRRPSLLDVALTDPRLTTMVIADGVHVSDVALRLLLRLKGTDRVALATDSIRHQGLDVRARGGAYYTKRGVLAGSRLTMLEAVRNAVQLGGASLGEAVRMATEVPARLLGLHQSRGVLAPGRRADLVVFSSRWRVVLTMVGGEVVYQPARS